MSVGILIGMYFSYSELCNKSRCYHLSVQLLPDIFLKCPALLNCVQHALEIFR